MNEGSLLGQYRLLSQLGQGAAGVVYLAEHQELGRRVALKVLRPDRVADAEALARFHQEAVAVNRIGNAHIVDVTDIGRSGDGQVFYVMELLQGETLAAWEKPYSVDNMEALAVTTDRDGAVLLWVMSDDNQSKTQRTLLMLFRVE